MVSFIEPDPLHYLSFFFLLFVNLSVYVWEINKCKDFKVLLHFEVQLWASVLSTPVF